MRKLHAVIQPRQRNRAVLHGPMTLGWTEFVIVMLVIVLVLLLTGFVVWPWG